MENGFRRDQPSVLLKDGRWNFSVSTEKKLGKNPVSWTGRRRNTQKAAEITKSLLLSWRNWTNAPFGWASLIRGGDESEANMDAWAGGDDEKIALLANGPLDGQVRIRNIEIIRRN